uniref:Staphylococcal nuclease domain-containing protein 1 n=1 Tax=Eurycantha calcarata TaxID=93610 RepID=A0A481UKZ8_9NEOP|nr:ebna2 binding protein P100 [Eurycantha calcarata]
MTTAPPPQVKRGIVKQVLSGDSIIIRGVPKGGPPPEKQINLSNITAPKLARRAIGSSDETKDEPYAWDCREFLRKKIIGEEILFTVEKPPNTTREYGVIYLGKDITTGENLTKMLVTEGLVSVRREGVRISDELQELINLEEQAKGAGKGKWAATGAQEHVRDIKWSIENMRNFVDKCGGKPMKAVIEHVRDGSTVRAFLLPDFYYITLMISGIRCPGFKLDAEGKPDPSAVVPYAEEAKFFVESHLLQRDVEIVLESVNNYNFVGSIIHPKGNIAEGLLREGFARCVDWSMAFIKTGAEKLRAAEKVAKDAKKRLWKDYQATGPQVTGKDKEFSGTVYEVVNGDALVIKLGEGTLKKVFLASIRPPRSADEKPGEPLPPRPKGSRPLYDIPWMFEAREFLRKKLIGKKVHVVVDYIQVAKDNFPEKVCCTVTIGGVNVAEAMVSKGLANVLRYRQDDDQRSSHYDELMAAEVKAIKSGSGLHSKKNIPTHRVADVSGDVTKAKQFFPFLQRAARTEAVVEFVASGSRLRLFIPKETCLVTFLLAGISCPRGARPGPGNVGTMDGEPFGEEALAFTKDKCLQREVEIHVESMDKAGNFIGWLWVDGTNLSVALVEDGYANIHFSAERSEHFRALKNAEDSAKAKRLRRWKDYVEEHEEEEKKVEEDKVLERKVDYKAVVVIETTQELHFYAQLVEQGPKLETLMSNIQQEFTTNPPLAGAYTPKRGDVCAAKFPDDNQWYRAKVEKVSGSQVLVFYIDYGNKESIKITDCASLPSVFTSEKGYAHEYALACVTLPKDPEYRDEAVQAFASDTMNHTLHLNVEYRVGSVQHVTLVDPGTEEDVVKALIADGLLMCESRREKRLQKLVNEYKAAQDSAKKAHLNMWEYGDVTEDDAKEFGV